MQYTSIPLIEALADIRELRRRVLNHQLFCLYSGNARIVGGWFALIGAFVLSRPWIPLEPRVHVIGWGVICVCAATLNFGTLARRWQSGGSPKLEQLRPVLDLVAPFIVGGILTYALITQAAYDLLFPSWMSLFGLMNIASRHSMPRTMVYLGWGYIACGFACLLSLPTAAFLNPWPMGFVFFVGEAIGGFAFIKMSQDRES